MSYYGPQVLQTEMAEHAQVLTADEVETRLHEIKTSSCWLKNGSVEKILALAPGAIALLLDSIELEQRGSTRRQTTKRKAGTAFTLPEHTSAGSNTDKNAELASNTDEGATNSRRVLDLHRRTCGAGFLGEEKARQEGAE
ncbi:unnamed protein product, partial [Pylaiella littoralis]